MKNFKFGLKIKKIHIYNLLTFVTYKVVSTCTNLLNALNRITLD